MAKYDQGGGCPCGLNKICDCKASLEPSLSKISSSGAHNWSISDPIKPQKRYNEDFYIQEIKSYIDSTYGAHYASKDGLQSIDIIKSSGNGQGFCIGNIQKLSARYGKKGSRKEQRQDLLKIIHYAILQLHEHDKIDNTPEGT